MALSASRPTLPESHRPLRERRQVSLVIIPVSYREWNKVYDCNDDLVLVFEDDKKNGDDQEQLAPPPSPTPSFVEESHLVKIIEGLHIALADEEAAVSALRTSEGKPFTHIMQVHFETTEANSPMSLENWRREEALGDQKVQLLDLYCPEDSLERAADEPAVAPKELGAARDFLSLVLPHGSEKWWPVESRKDGPWGEEQKQGELSGTNGLEGNGEKKQDGNDEQKEHVEGTGEKGPDGLGEPKVQVEDDHPQFVVLAPDYGIDPDLSLYADQVEPDEVNVLIVAPTTRAVDVVSILLCYLGFLQGTSIKKLTAPDYHDKVWAETTIEMWSFLYVDLMAQCK